MKKGNLIFLSAVISIIFISALTWFGINLYNEKNEGPERCRSTWISITKKLEKSLPDVAIEDLIDDFNEVNAITITKNHEIIEAFPEMDLDFEKISNSNFVQSFIVTKTDSSHNIYTVQAALYTLRPAVIFSYGKTAFLVILIATVFTLLLSFLVKQTTSKTKIIKNNGHSESKTEPEYSSENYIEPKSVQEIIPEENEEENSESDEIYFVEETVQENEVPEENPYEDSQELEKMTENNEPEKNSEPAQENTRQESVSLPFQESTVDFVNENKNIYSEKTPFIRQEFLISRLNNEITKSGSFELDLSLFLIKIPELDGNSELIEKISNTLLGIFQFREFIFEYGTDGFAVIKPDLDINKAEEEADGIYKAIREEISGFGLKDCFIGISSTASRLISSDRLLTESQKALEHAESDKESSIIGFHVDLDKYRNFIKNS